MFLCAAVAYLYCISIENLMQFVVTWEMFANQMEELLCDICCHGFTIWWVEPYDVAFSISCTTACVLDFVLKFRSVSISFLKLLHIVVL